MSDRLLRICLRAYPRKARERDGEVLLDLARELVDGGSPALWQAAGLLRGGASARLLRAPGEPAKTPWLEARLRLALPLAAALLALGLVGVERSTDGLAWIGWSWAVALTGAAAAFAGAALGRRGLTAAGALMIVTMLGLDAVRDLYGAGSRWSVGASSFVVDVLVMWLPAALLLLACAGAVQRAPAQVALRRMAWGVLPGVVLLLLSSERPSAAEGILIFGGFVAAAALVVVGVARRRADPATTLAAALVLAAVAPQALWLSAALLPPPDSGTAALPILYLTLTGALAAAGIVGLARLARR
jgi:hypothetical protein